MACVGGLGVGPMVLWHKPHGSAAWQDRGTFANRLAAWDALDDPPASGSWATLPPGVHPDDAEDDDEPTFGVSVSASGRRPPRLSSGVKG